MSKHLETVARKKMPFKQAETSEQNRTQWWAAICLDQLSWV